MPRKTRTISAPAPTTKRLPHIVGYVSLAVVCLGAGAGIGYKLGKSQSIVAASPISTKQIALDCSLGNAAFDQKDWPAAIDAYTAAIAAGDNDPDVYTDLGTAYRFNNQPQLALQEYQTAHAKWPSHENSLFNQGGLYAYSLNEPDQAIKTWQAYLLQFPNGSHTSDAEQLIADAKAHMVPAGKTE